MQEASRDIDAELRILSSLAKPEALKIFAACEVGIENSTQSMKKLCLTPKCYYTNLKRLIKAGLVEKRGHIYVQTVLGKFCSKMEKAFSRVISQRDQLQLADKLMDSDTLSTEEKEKILNVISDEGLLGVSGLADVIREVRMITNFDVFIDEVIKILDNAQETAYMAVGKTDTRATDAVINAMDRGVRLYLLSTEKVLEESSNVLKMILNPSMVKVGLKLINSKELNLKITENLVFSFVMVDGEYGLIELPHPTSDKFYVAFEFKNPFFCRNLEDTFLSLYEKAREDPRIETARKYLTFYK